MSGETCPGCGSSNTTTEHLMWEYRDFMRETLHGFYYRNARIAQDAVARMLIARGVTELPNVFGAIPIGLWED